MGGFERGPVDRGYVLRGVTVLVFSDGVRCTTRSNVPLSANGFTGPVVAIVGKAGSLRRAMV